MHDDDDPAAHATPETYSAEYVAALREDAERRIVHAELKARAAAAGMVDADGLKLLDTSQVKLDDHGNILLPDGFFETARRAKPYLFARATTGSTARAPEAAPPPARNATEMSFDEWQSARSDLLRRR